MSDKSVTSEEIEAELTLRDRINFPYLLAQQIMTFQQAILNMDLSTDEINEAIEGLLRMIPESWKDDKFSKAVEDAVSKVTVDVRPTYCGLKASYKFCIDNGIVPTIEQEEKDYYALFQACIDLFDRRQLLSKYAYTEIMTGRRFKKAQELETDKMEDKDAET